MMKELGLDDETMKELYEDDVTTESQSEALPGPKNTEVRDEKKPSPLARTKKVEKEEESDSWDDTVSLDEPIQKNRGRNVYCWNFLCKVNGMLLASCAEL